MPATPWRTMMTPPRRSCSSVTVRAFHSSGHLDCSLLLFSFTSDAFCLALHAHVCLRACVRACVHARQKATWEKGFVSAHSIVGKAKRQELEATGHTRSTLHGVDRRAYTHAPCLAHRPLLSHSPGIPFERNVGLFRIN